MGYVEWNTQEIAEVFLPLLSEASNLEDFIIKFKPDPSNMNHPLYGPDFIG